MTKYLDDSAFLISTIGQSSESPGELAKQVCGPISELLNQNLQRLSFRNFKESPYGEVQM